MEFIQYYEFEIVTVNFINEINTKWKNIDNFIDKKL